MCRFFKQWAKTKTETIPESEVPKAVKDSYGNSIGFPVNAWGKLTLNNGPRYVAVTEQMNPSSGKMLQYRYRYNSTGNLTSSSQYRGTGKGEGADFFPAYLGTGGVSDAFAQKVMKLTKDNEVVSFEGFDFAPGNETTIISTHRFVLKSNGKISVLYFDHDGKDVDMSKYPLRKIEAEELD